MYRVLETFRDKQTGFVYYKGDTFPKSGIKVDEKRIKELEGKSNAFKKPLIEKKEAKKKTSTKKKTTKKKEEAKK